MKVETQNKRDETRKIEEYSNIKNNADERNSSFYKDAGSG